MYGCILFTAKTGQCSDVAPDEREAEPGAGLLGNVKCTFRGLETLGSHKDWFGRSWEGLLGRPWPKRPWQGLKGSIGRSWPGGKVEGNSHFCPPDHGLVRSSCFVFEDGSSISPRVARVPLPAHEADRLSCSSSVGSGVPNWECCAR